MSIATSILYTQHKGQRAKGGKDGNDGMMAGQWAHIHIEQWSTNFEANEIVEQASTAMQQARILRKQVQK